MKYEIAQCSLTGNRASNQDRQLVLEAPDAVLMALADGMGGHPKGEVAAQLLMDTARKAFLTSRKPIQNPRVFLSGLMDMAHQKITDYGKQQEPPIEPRTTGVLCLIQENSVFWAHIGDSRLYIMRDNVICTRTDDHSYVEHLRQQGIISSAQVHTHRFRNYVTRCLGGTNNHPVAALGGPHILKQGDIVLICSDGFWSPIPERKLVEAVYRKQDKFSNKVNQLAYFAEHVSQPESDNVTVTSLYWKDPSLVSQPSDISMSISSKKKDAAIIDLRKNDAEIKDAIEELRKAADEVNIE